MIDLYQNLPSSFTLQTKHPLFLSLFLPFPFTTTIISMLHDLESAPPDRFTIFSYKNYKKTKYHSSSTLADPSSCHSKTC